MNNKKSMLETVKALALSVIGMEEEKKEEVNLATETVGEGEATLEAEAFEAGNPVFIVDGEERIALPVGEYMLDSGMILVVEEEGVIAAMKEKEEEMVEEEEAVAQNETPTETPLPKAIIESVVKETKFSKEDMDAKDAEILALKAEIEELKQPKEVELSVEEEVKPITHNPENANPQPVKFQFSKNRKRNGLDNIMSKISKL